jgi:DNA/RNA-binding domain of Phe-tRNA-synthetase-like protein
MLLEVEDELQERFQGLSAQVGRVRGLEIVRELPELEEFKSEVFQRARERWTLDQLREEGTFRAYRDFFWRMGVDPTKIRPASEALLRRVLRGRSLPVINTFVDAYNLASVETAIPLAAFDEDQLSGSLLMRMAEAGELFLGIGMEKPVELKGKEAVVDDGQKLVAIYPYRDADACKITTSTRNVLMLFCGVPNIGHSILRNAGRVAVDYVTRFCGGAEA